MFDFFKNLDFTLDSSFIRHLCDLSHLKNLNRNSLPGPHMHTKFDFAKSAFTQVFEHPVFTDLLQVFLMVVIRGGCLGNLLLRGPLGWPGWGLRRGLI